MGDGCGRVVGREQAGRLAAHPESQKTVGRAWTWPVSLDAVQDGVNVVEILPSPVEGSLEWGEI